MELEGKKVLVVGLGASGLAAARLCHARGARVTATDLAQNPPAAAGLAELEVKLALGGHRPQDFSTAELIVLSPGVDHRREEVAAAKDKGVEVIGELELGFRFLETPSVMITGTNGKSTVTTLVGEMLAKAGKKVFLGGNLGTPLCEYVAKQQKADWVVLEVSSFQTDTSVTLRPEVGVMLNLSPDHLDRYSDFESYAASKFSLFTRQAPDQLVVFCFDDPEVRKRLALAPARHWAYGRKGIPRPGGWLENSDLVLAGENGDIRLSAKNSKLLGGFNQLNMLAASLASLACGADTGSMQAAIDGFEGLPHRLQFVASHEGVDYYDDSKGTNTSAVQAVLESLERPLVLLLGGRDKGGRFRELANFISNSVRGVICFGEAGPAIHGQISGFTKSRVVADLPAAVKAARDMARPGDLVLLSPGCASFDAYQNYGRRGEHFQALVKEMARG